MEEKETQARQGQELYYWLQTVLVPLVCIIMLFTFVARVTRVDGISMDSTLSDNELLLVWSLGYEPTEGDVVIASIPGCEILQGAIVKRCIATEGQTVTVDYTTNTVTVDGEVVVEDYINEYMNQLYTAPNPVMTYEVPEHHVFLMGDNRNHSTDSRDPAVGFVPEDCILGTAKVVLFPFNKIGLL